MQRRAMLAAPALAAPVLLTSPAQAQAPRIVTEEFMVPVGDGIEIFVRNKRPETPIVVLKKVRSQPRQNPPGSSATTLPTTPRLASSSTIRAPIELPTTSIPVSSFSKM